jgi:hypothetical protein
MQSQQLIVCIMSSTYLLAVLCPLASNTLLCLLASNMHHCDSCATSQDFEGSVRRRVVTCMYQTLIACMQMTAVRAFEGFVLGVLKRYQAGCLKPPEDARESAGPCSSIDCTKPFLPDAMRN